MSWGRLDDSILNHPKFEGIELSTMGLWCRGIAWVIGALTDGFIPLDAARRLAGSYQAARKHIPILVTRRLWDEVPGGYMVHNYLKWNLSKAEIAEKKRIKSLAGKRGAERRWSDGSSHSTSHPVTDGISHGECMALTHPITTEAVSGSTPRGDATAPLRSPEGLAAPSRPTPAPESNGSRQSRDDALADLARLTGTTVDELRESAAKLRRPR